MTERVAVGLTLFGEARGEPIEGRIAVASVLRNRLRSKRWGTTYIAVVGSPKQFSCWNHDDPNRAELLRLREALKVGGVVPAMVRECLWIADGLIGNLFESNVGPATHYYATWLPQPPRWSIGAPVIAEVGRHRFYAVK